VRSRCRVIEPRTVEEVAQVLAQINIAGDTGLLARGAGRSYGDAALNTHGVVLDMSGVNAIVAVDRERSSITAQAGATIADLLAALAPHGLTLPVVPGTRHVTLAGAIASDIHGKNHHRDGAFARHVASISLWTPARGAIEVTPATDPDLFYATLGGMGLTGVILDATLRAERLYAPWVIADTYRTDSLAQTLALLSGPDPRRYSVAWLDLLASDRHFGRAVITHADPAPADQAPSHSDRIPADTTQRAGQTGQTRQTRQTERTGQPGRMERTYPRALLRRPVLEVPRGLPTALLHPASLRAFNAVRWRTSPCREHERPVAIASYFFPLDGLGEWNRLYGSTGLIQYQFVIPAGQETALERSFELIRTRRLPVYLAVFKRFGPAGGGPLSFPLHGWTLAIDLPAAAPGVYPALTELDELVAGCGGRVYLTKDARLSREALAAMYSGLDRFYSVRARVDPEGVMRSDLALRLGLCAGTSS
jgi:decaprenylphospho-beta-D-ribofuranose 2-oxidase